MTLLSLEKQEVLVIEIVLNVEHCVMNAKVVT